MKPDTNHPLNDQAPVLNRAARGAASRPARTCSCGQLVTGARCWGCNREHALDERESGGAR